MKASTLEHTILDLTVEDSYALSEILNRVSGLEGGGRRGAIRAEVREAVLRMLSSGLLVATWLEEPDGPEEPLDESVARQALADDLEWVFGGPWRPHMRVCASALGRERYFGPGR